MEVLEGVVWCEECRTWYAIEDGFLDFLTGALAHTEAKDDFWRKREADLSALGLSRAHVDGWKSELATQEPGAVQARQQQKHFDWYVSNKKQRYSDYEATPFWRAADRIAFEPWRNEIRQKQPAGRWLLDVGCAQGRSTFHMMDLDLDIVGFDVSRECVREAARRYREAKPKSRASFLVADGSEFPLQDATFDYVLIYGVLHHLDDPGRTCQEVGRVLKSDGVYFGQENNTSAFRVFFDLLQKVWAQWHEEAGPEAIISADRLAGWLNSGRFQVSSRTSVFVPPHVLNWTSEAAGFQILSTIDRVLSKVPWLRRNGGLIIFEARRPAGGSIIPNPQELPSQKA